MGGTITGPILDMSNIGTLLFMVALPMAFVSRRRIAGVVMLLASLLCLPIYLYSMFPGIPLDVSGPILDTASGERGSRKVVSHWICCACDRCKLWLSMSSRVDAGKTAGFVSGQMGKLNPDGVRELRLPAGFLDRATGLTAATGFRAPASESPLPRVAV